MVRSCSIVSLQHSNKNMLEMFVIPHTIYYLTKSHFDSTWDSKEISIRVHKSNYDYPAMLMMTSQIFKSADTTKA